MEPGLALSKAPTALVSGLLAASHNGVRPKWSRTFGVHGHFQPVEASELPYSTQYLSAKHIEREQPRPGAISVDLHRPKHSGAAICRRHPRRLCRSCPLKISSDLSTYRQQVKATSTSTPLHQEGIKRPSHEARLRRPNARGEQRTSPKTESRRAGPRLTYCMPLSPLLICSTKTGLCTEVRQFFCGACSGKPRAAASDLAPLRWSCSSPARSLFFACPNRPGDQRPGSGLR